MPKLRISWALALLVSSAAAHADDPQALPSAWLFDAQPLENVETLTLPEVDRDALAIEDAQRELAGLPPRFAVPFEAGVAPDTHGLWEDLDSATQVWRFRIRAERAASLNLGFTRYRLPEDAQLLVYSADGLEVRGPFTGRDDAGRGELWTPVLLTDDLVVEVTVPAERRGELDLLIGRVNSGYRGFSVESDVVLSGACNMDIECLPGGDPWRDNARAVGVFTVSGTWTCSGSLLNNTAQDRKLYFMTANHCGVNAGNAAAVVAYWNYRNSTCRTPGSPASGGPGDGSLAQFYSGATFRAANGASDFTLIEFTPGGGPNPAFGHFWGGWNRASSEAACSNSTHCTGIHHPSTDEMRITFSDVPTITSSWGGTPPPQPGDGTHVWVHWDASPPHFPSPPGVTEPGSSGSAFYDENRRFVGQLHGGASACGATGDNLSDIYGRFSVSWTGGGTNSTRVSNWLDPGNTGAITIDGINLCTPPPAPTNVVAAPNGDNRIDVSWTAVAGAEHYRVFRSLGACPGGQFALLADNVVATTYADTDVLGGVTYSYQVTAVDEDQPCESGPSACDDATATGSCPVPDAPTLVSPMNGTSGHPVRPQFSWNAAPTADDYDLEVDDNADFSSPVYTATVAGTNHVAASDLPLNTPLFWRVTANNVCGAGSASAVWHFAVNQGSAPIDECFDVNVPIPDNVPAGVTNNQSVAASAPITDLDVSVTMQPDHTWIGDLIFRVTKGATTVTFVDRPGVPVPGGAGCSDNLDFVRLDDEAATPIETHCPGATINGTFSPNQALSAFDGLDINGSWTLFASDNAGLDTGTIDQWCLHYSTVAEDMPFLDGFETNDTSRWSSTIP